ncbi:carbamoyl-phosphate synthase large subunit [Thalassobacillus cyri]|uniref:Carbamoyl-phosphate synthase large subunit n=1 Tax=Thalassobacillus cyri TaxID=571932 RepID=A0A1H3XSX1_9BACI|nr:ATP-grasp domain-containing protein [Thalassobacillus cyri]SEA02476.1 carbamoyl-phosphate synthase large subunit [Thalassobacillus cyri]
MNVLLTSGARRIDFVGFFQEAMKNAGILGQVVVADPDHNAPSLQAGDKNYVIPHQTDERYIEAILHICKENDIKAIVPLNDWEVPKIANYKKELMELGVSVFTPDPQVVQKVRDKGKYREMLGSFGVVAPRSYLKLNDAVEALNNKEVSFPLIVKPRNGSASMGVEIVNDVEEMEFAYQHAVKTVKETPLADATSKDPEDNVLIEEVIEGEKFSLDMFNDLEGNFLASFVRKQLAMRGGDVDRCVTVHQKELDDIARKMGENLRHAGYMNADVYYDGKEYYVIDINPRFGGGYAFTHIAGADIPSAILALTDGRKVKKEWLQDDQEIELARHDRVVRIDERNVQNTFTEAGIRQ